MRTQPIEAWMKEAVNAATAPVVQHTVHSLLVEAFNRGVEAAADAFRGDAEQKKAILALRLEGP